MSTEPIHPEEGEAAATQAATAKDRAAPTEAVPARTAETGAAQAGASHAGTAGAHAAMTEAAEAPVMFYFVRHGRTRFNQQSKVQGWCDSPLVAEGVDVARAMGRQLAHVEFAAAYASDMGRTRQTMAELLDARAAAREGAAPERPAAPAAKAAEEGGSDPAADAAAANGAVIAAASPSTPRAARLLAALDGAAADAPAVLDGIPARCDARLREWCYGDLEGGSGELLHRRLVEGFGEELSFAQENERLPETADNLAKLDPTGHAEHFAIIVARIQAFLHGVGEATLAAGGGNVLCTTHAFTIRTLMYLLDRSRVNDPLVILNGSLTRVSYDGARFELLETGVTELPGCFDRKESRAGIPAHRQML